MIYQHGMTISLIAAVGNNRVIGSNNQLPWHMPRDMKFFMNKTKGHYVIMGRKNFESINKKPLPNRTNIVITRDKDYEAPGAYVVHSLEEAIAKVGTDEEPFIIGGSEIYRQAISIIDRMYITRIYGDFEGNSFFPEVDYSQWRLKKKDAYEADEKNPYPYAFFIYER